MKTQELEHDEVRAKVRETYGKAANNDAGCGCAPRPQAAPVWSILFDGEIPGAWSKYATVWRVVPAMPARDYLNPQSLFFFW